MLIQQLVAADVAGVVVWANPLTGALKFELPEGKGARVEPRGERPPLKKGRGKHTQGQPKHPQG